MQLYVQRPMTLSSLALELRRGAVRKLAVSINRDLQCDTPRQGAWSGSKRGLYQGMQLLGLPRPATFVAVLNAFQPRPTPASAQKSNGAKEGLVVLGLAMSGVFAAMLLVGAERSAWGVSRACAPGERVFRVLAEFGLLGVPQWWLLHRAQDLFAQGHTKQALACQIGSYVCGVLLEAPRLAVTAGLWVGSVGLGLSAALLGAAAGCLGFENLFGPWVCGRPFSEDPWADPVYFAGPVPPEAAPLPQTDPCFDGPSFRRGKIPVGQDNFFSRPRWPFTYDPLFSLGRDPFLNDPFFKRAGDRFADEPLFNRFANEPSFNRFANEPLFNRFANEPLFNRGGFAGPSAGGTRPKATQPNGTRPNVEPVRAPPPRKAAKVANVLVISAAADAAARKRALEAAANDSQSQLCLQEQHNALQNKLHAVKNGQRGDSLRATSLPLLQQALGEAESLAEFRRLYRQRSLAVHPDKLGPLGLSAGAAAVASQCFVITQAAYELAQGVLG